MPGVLQSSHRPEIAVKECAGHLRTRRGPGSRWRSPRPIRPDGRIVLILDSADGPGQRDRCRLSGRLIVRVTAVQHQDHDDECRQTHSGGGWPEDRTLQQHRPNSVDARVHRKHASPGTIVPGLACFLLLRAVRLQS